MGSRTGTETSSPVSRCCWYSRQIGRGLKETQKLRQRNLHSQNTDRQYSIHSQHSIHRQHSIHSQHSVHTKHSVHSQHTNTANICDECPVLRDNKICVTKLYVWVKPCGLNLLNSRVYIGLHLSPKMFVYMKMLHVLVDSMIDSFIYPL